MMKVLVDSNIVIDIALQREPFYASSREVMRCFEQTGHTGCIAATTITNMFYILRKPIGRENAIEMIRSLMDSEGIELLGVDKQVVREALEADMKDFEDAVQASVASITNLDYIVTRNLKDFVKSSVPAVLPEDFLQIFKNMTINQVENQ